jgi:hypothetical protein
MAQINLKFRVPGDPDHWEGLIMSLLVLVRDVLASQRRATVINHFSRERLSKNERKQLLRSIDMILSDSLAESNENLLTESEFTTDNVPDDYIHVFRMLQSFSR